ncbi:MAG: DUF3237 domain-containing protein [Deltaproteobacteria bacterium]
MARPGLMFGSRCVPMTAPHSRILPRHHQRSAGSHDRISKNEAVEPSEIRYRTTPVSETGSEKYGRLNRIAAVGVVKRTPTAIESTVCIVLKERSQGRSADFSKLKKERPE